MLSIERERETVRVSDERERKEKKRVNGNFCAPDEVLNFRGKTI